MDVKFQSSGEVSSLGLEYSFELSNFRSGLPRQSNTKVILSSATLSVNVQDKEQPLEFLFSPSDRVTISPVQTNVYNQESVSIDLSHADNSPSKIDMFVITATEKYISFSIDIPSIFSLKLCESALVDGLTTEHKDIIDKRYEGNSTKDRSFAFLSEISQWITLPQYVILVNELASLDTKFKSIVNTTPHRYFGKLLFENEDRPHTIDSPELMDKIRELRENLPELDPIPFEPLLKRSINAINTQEVDRASWKIVRRLRLTERDPAEISMPMKAWILSLHCLQNDWETFDNLVDKWVLSYDNKVDINERISEIQSMPYEDRPEAWLELIPAARSSNLGRDRYVIASCFDDTAEISSLPRIVRAKLYETASFLYGNIDAREYERTAIYHSLIHRGVHFREVGRYEIAIELHQNAFSYAMEEKRENGEARFTSVAWAIVMLTESYVSQAKARGNLEDAQDAIEEQINRLDALAVNEQSADNHRTSLQAWKHEITGDIRLRKQEYDAVIKSYGKAAGYFGQVNRHGNRKYLLRRKHAVQAAAAELRGEFEKAATEHSQVQSSLPDSNHFAIFNAAREQICRAKAAILNFELTKASQELSEITEPPEAVTEAEDLELLIHALEDFEANNISPMNLLEELSTRVNTHNFDNGIRIDYGHEYDQTLVTVLAVQRLPREDIDKQLIKQLVKTSIKQLFTPTEVTQEIERSGLSEFSMENQWKARLPLHIRKELQQIESSEPNMMNYTPLSLQLVRLVELFFEPLVDFHAQREWGDNFEEEIGSPSELSLGSLQHILLNKEVLDNTWETELCDLLQESCFESDSQEYTIVECRNRLMHGKNVHEPDSLSELSKDEYHRLKTHINNIMRICSTEYPCLGRVTGTDGMGRYHVELYRGGLREHANVASDQDITVGSVYYFPTELLSQIPRIDARETEFIKCTTERTLNKLPGRPSG